MTIPSNMSRMGVFIRPGPSSIARGSLSALEAAVVVTVTLTVAAVPFSVTEVGETVQVDWAGAPLQLSATSWLNPAEGARLIM